MIDSVFYTGSFLLPENKILIHSECFYNELCYVTYSDIPKYKPIVINFLVYDIWYIIILILFLYIWYLAFVEVKENYFNS